MDKICGVYKIENLITKEIYIGSSKNIEGRIKDHSVTAHSDIKKKYYVHNAIHKYGIENFVYEILIQCHPDMLAWYEQLAIDRWEPEYNISKLAGRVEATEDIRRKRSEFMKGNQYMLGYKYSEDAKRKMSESRKGRLGHKHSEESKRKISEARKCQISPTLGYKYSEESKRKISESRKGKKHSEEAKHKMSAALMGNQRLLGYIPSEETRRKISEASKRYWETRRKQIELKQIELLDAILCNNMEVDYGMDK